MNEREIRVLLIISKKTISNQEKEYLKQEGSKCNWRNIILAARHNKVLTMMALNVEKYELQSLLSKYEYKAINNYKIGNFERNRIIYFELEKLLEIIEKTKIEYVILKGGVVGPLLYKSEYIRELGDVDILIRRKDASLISNILKEAGYKQGWYDSEKGEILGASRKQIIQQNVNTHEMIEFLKLTSNEHCKMISIDVNFEIMWKGFSEKSINYNEFFSNIEYFEFNKVQLKHLKSEYNLIQLCAHLYSEAVLFSLKDTWKNNPRELILMRLIDIYELLKNTNLNWEKVFEIIDNYGLKEIVFFVFCILNSLYLDIISQDKLSNFDYGTDITNKFYDKTGQVRYWEINIMDRLFDLKKKMVEVDKIIKKGWVI